MTDVFKVAMRAGWLTLALVGFCYCVKMIGSSNHNEYRRACTVLAKYGTLTTVELSDGNLYDFDDVDNTVNVGDNIIVTFDDNNTSSIYDDEIISVKRVDR